MDANGLITTGSKIMSVYTSHTANAVSSDLAFLTRNAGTIAEKMRLTAAGNLGISTTSPSSKLSLSQSANSATNGLWIAGTDGDFRSLYMSDTSGTLSFQGGNTAGTYNTATLDVNGAWTNASDRAYKENIVDLSTKYGLSTILQTSPRFYTMKGSGNPQVGFIAQELKLLIPEVVDGEEGSYSLSYGNLVAVAFEGIKELN